jgi:hypothetical protein
MTDSMQQHGFDRGQEDLGNIIHLEHVNTCIPDQRLSTLFYVTGLTLTRDPYLMTSTDNMWVNAGRSQFHLPTNKPQVLRGHTGLVIPDRELVLHKLAGVRRELDGTRFAFSERDSYIEAVSPWGNRIRVYEPNSRFGRIQLGIPYVEFDVPTGAADGIARFYREIFRAPAECIEDGEGRIARVAVGIRQHLIYRETDRKLPDYDRHHIQVYIANFSDPHRRLRERALITEESDQWQYRFVDIVDPESGAKLFAIEHEVRSMTHPLYARPLVNRNPHQTNLRYAPDHETREWALPYRD